MEPPVLAATEHERRRAECRNDSGIPGDQVVTIAGVVQVDGDEVGDEALNRSIPPTSRADPSAAEQVRNQKCVIERNAVMQAPVAALPLRDKGEIMADEVAEELEVSHR